MNFTSEELAVLEKASNSLMFDDLFEFVLTKWPKKIKTSNRKQVNFDKLQGTIEGLIEIEDSNNEYFDSLNIGNLLIHLNHSLLIAIHKAGLVQDSVKPKDINRLYVRYLFENKSIRYALETDVEKIPFGLRDNLDAIYDKNLIKDYFQRNV